MVARNMGIGVLPQGSVEPFLETEGLVSRPLDEPWAHRKLMLISKPVESLPLMARVLRTHLAGGDAAGGD
jgi:DNA-binding transcriptional LysR family regulator